MTAVYAVLGRPIAGSRSPAIHNAWFETIGIDATYVALEIAPGRDANVVDAVRTLGLAGANVTAPLKRTVAAQVDALEGDAAVLGAVNVLVREGERWIGANTDGPGFVLALQDAGEPIAGRSVAIVGAGGAGAAVALALAREGIAQLHLVNRTPASAEALAARLRAAVPGLPVVVSGVAADALRAADLVVLAVTEEVDLDPPRAATTWIDLRYGPREPATSTRARAAGHRVLDGSGLLLRQAALSFERWTGRRPPLPLDLK